MSNRDLKYRILGDNLLGKAVGGAIGALGRLKNAGMSAISSMVGGMRRILKRGLQIGFAGTIAGAIWSVKDAMAVQEIESKFDAVFKALSASARDWSKSFAASTKRSEYDVRQWMASIQDTLVPMGIARDEAAKMSRDITALGVDLGSFSNIDAGEAIERIIGTLTGAHMNARKFGVVITEAALQQKAFEMGLAKANQPLSEQAKLLARLKMLQDGTSDAQGDAIKTAGSLTNRFRGMLAAFKSFRVEIGTQIADGLKLAQVFGAMERGISGFIEKIKESKAVERWAEKARALLVDVAAVGKALATPGKTGDTLKAIGNVIWEAFKAGASTAVGVLLKAMPILGRILGETAKAAMKDNATLPIDALMGWIVGGNEHGRKAASIQNQLANNPGMYLDLEKEFRALIDKKDIDGAKRFARGLEKLNISPDKLLAGDYRPGADMSGMLGSGGGVDGLKGAIDDLRNLVRDERAAIEKIMAEPKEKLNWDDTDWTKPEDVIRYFRSIGDTRSDDDLLATYLQTAAKELPAKVKDGLRGWSDGDVSGKGGIWGSRKNRWKGTREDNQNMQGLSGWGGAGNVLTSGQSRRGVDLGEIFTRIHRQGAGGGKSPEEQQVGLLKQIDTKLGNIEKKPAGGMRP